MAGTSESDLIGNSDAGISYSVIRDNDVTPPPPPPGVVSRELGQAGATFSMSEIAVSPTVSTTMTTMTATMHTNITTAANDTLKIGTGGVISILDIDISVLGDKLIPYLRQFEWIVFGSICKHCMYAFGKYLKFAANSSNVYAKHVPMRALRQYLLRKPEKYYPLALLNILKQNGAQASDNSAEYLGKLRHAVTEDDLFTVSILLDFGVSSERVIFEIMDRYCGYDISDSMFKLLLSKIRNLNTFHNSFNKNINYYRNQTSNKRLEYYPIHLECIYNGHLSYLKVIIKYYLDAIDWNYVTPKYNRNLAFWAACARDSEDYLEFLDALHQTQSVDMGCKDIYGRNSAFLCIRHNRIDALVYLIEECGIDVDSCDKWNNTLLHYCCERGNSQCLEYLLSKGANFQLKNESNELPIDIAIFYNRHECMKLLQMYEKNANNNSSSKPNVENSKQRESTVITATV